MRKIRVCVDCAPLLVRSAGVKTYVYHWVEALRRLAGPDRVGLFPAFTELGPCLHEESVLGPWPTILGLSLIHASNVLPLPVLDVLGVRYNVFHASHLVLKPPRTARLSTTLYDMTCWLVPEMHDAENVSRVKLFADRVMKRADGIIAISESSRADAVRILSIDPERIRVIYPGVSPAFFSAKPTGSAKPYLLFVGTIEPRKNVGVLLDAYEQLPASVREEYDLVVAGSPGWGDSAVLDRLDSKPPGVRYLGYVAEEELPGLTAGAAAFVYPSLYEGFGLPVAQAMAAGVPVIASNTSSLPEVAGDGGLLVDPRSTNELRDAMMKMLTCPSVRADLARKSAERARLFDWQTAAKQSWEFFEEIA
jgi:glycosyltransferase involved in cell wall biosynthesis